MNILSDTHEHISRGRPKLTVSIQGLNHSYGTRRALSDVSFDIHERTSVALLGRNGAGKSTLLKVIAQILPTPWDLYTIRPESTGYMPEVPALYDELTVKEQIIHSARLNGMAKTAIMEIIDEKITEFGLDDVQSLQCRKLSKGYRQRVSLLMAFIHSPELVILDEPTAGLDPKQSEATRAIILKQSMVCTVILSSHNLREAQELCGDIAILEGGIVVERGTKAQLSEKIALSRRIEGVVIKETMGNISKENGRNLTREFEQLIRQTKGFIEIESLEMRGYTESECSKSTATVATKSTNKEPTEDISRESDSGTEEIRFSFIVEEKQPKITDISTRLIENGFAIKSFTEVEISIDEIFRKFTRD